MTDSRKDQEDWVVDVTSTPAYQSVHGDREPRIAGSSPEGFDWKVIIGSIVIILVLLTGIVIAVRSTQVETGWPALRELKVSSDEAYLYLVVKTGGKSATPDWDRYAFAIAIDTYDSRRGARRLPPPLSASTGSGVEFLVTLRGPENSDLRVIDGYDPFDGENPVYSPREQTDVFHPLRFQSNRERFGRDGTYFPSASVERGRLRFGSLDPSSPDFDTRTDVSIGEGIIEIRIPWALLNVTDPSSRMVVHSVERGRTEIGTIRTEGFRIYAFSFNLTKKRLLADRLPTGGGTAPLYRWSDWDSPVFEMEPKRGLGYVTEAMERIPDHPRIEESFD
jgi:hypothetical protein